MQSTATNQADSPSQVVKLKAAEAREVHETPARLSDVAADGKVRQLCAQIESPTASTPSSNQAALEADQSSPMLFFGEKLPVPGDLPVVSFLAASLIPASVAAFTLLLSRWDLQALPGSYIIFAALSGVLAALIFGKASLQRNSARLPLLSKYLETLRKWLIVVGIVGTLGYMTNAHNYFSPLMLGAWSILTPLMLIASQHIARTALRDLVLPKVPARNAVIIGANPVSDALGARIADDDLLNIRIRGVFDDRKVTRFPTSLQMRRLGHLCDTADYVKKNDIALAFLCLPGAGEDRVTQLLDELGDTTVSVYFVPEIPTTESLQAGMSSTVQVPLVAMWESPIYGFRRVAKRAFDMVVAALALLVASPVFVAIAAAVKLSSPGPVIFRQARNGLNGKKFSVYKFRSMRVCEDGNHITQATSNDARVTEVGRFLRRTSLDELPQIINVLKGEMSIVGPRPHAVSHNEMYRKQITGYMLRHKVMPGITGWAQVNGYRGETETLEKMQSRVKFDLFYMQNWSFALDLWIVMKTFRLIFRDSNAY